MIRPGGRVIACERAREGSPKWFMRVASCRREILQRLNFGTFGSRSTLKRAAWLPGAIMAVSQSRMRSITRQWMADVLFKVRLVLSRRENKNFRTSRHAFRKPK